MCKYVQCSVQCSAYMDSRTKRHYCKDSRTTGYYCVDSRTKRHEFDRYGVSCEWATTMHRPNREDGIPDKRSIPLVGAEIRWLFARRNALSLGGGSEATWI
ncbi:uncharacterized protein [Linepithema humile]|uniref:uncharacterized protein n=1 Tax=Linepithema humile TaxID=83485 RepID=UPI00351DE1F8